MFRAAFMSAHNKLQIRCLIGMECGRWLCVQSPVSAVLFNFFPLASLLTCQQLLTLYIRFLHFICDRSLKSCSFCFNPVN
jgi:hypothetical protein